MKKIFHFFLFCLIAVANFLPIACQNSISVAPSGSTPTPTPISVSGTWTGTISCGGPSYPWSGIFTQNGASVALGVNTGGSCNYVLTGTLSGTTIIASESSVGLNATVIFNNSGTTITSGNYTITNAPSGCSLCSSNGIITGNR